MQQHLPQIRPASNGYLTLQQPFSLHPGVELSGLHLRPPASSQSIDFNAPSARQLRYQMDGLQCKIRREYLQVLVTRTLSGGGLSDLNISSQGSRVEISGLLSREGQRTPFLVRGFLYEPAGPYGGVVFFDIRAFGRPGIPAPALIPLLAARTGRHGPINIRGCITLQFDLPSLLLRWGMAANGWKIPSYRHLQLQQISQQGDTLLFDYSPSNPNASLPFAQEDPAYPEWTSLCMSEQRHLRTETLLGNGEYATAMQAYAEALWREPDDIFLQERLMQLYIASPQRDLWTKAYRIAEGILQHNPQSSVALNCMAQYAEGLQDLQTAAHFYKQIGEVARRQLETNEASLAFGKAAELLERIDPTHAYELWKLAVAQNPNYRPAITALTRHALKSGQFVQAEQILRQLIDQTPPSVERARYHLSLAGLYRSRLRDLDKAREQLDQAAPYLNEDLPFLRELAEFRLATDENVDALRILDRLANRAQMLKQPSLYADLLYRTGQILEERLGRPTQALPRYREVSQARPNHPHATKRIQALQNVGVQPEPLPLGSFEAPLLLIAEKEQALQSYEHLPSEQLRLHLELCRLYWQQQDVTRAIQAGYEALKIQSTHEVAWQLLEEICVRTGRHTELATIHQQMVAQAMDDEAALRHLEEALRLLPTDRKIIQQLSQYYDKLGEWEKLDVLYSRWLEVAEPHESSTIMLQQARLREEQLQRQDMAELSYVQAFQADPSNQNMLEALIKLYLRMNDLNKLDLQLSHLSQSLPEADQARLYAEKGRQLHLMQEYKSQALDAYQKALMLAPDNLQILRPTITLLREQNHISSLAPLLERLADQLEDSSKEVEVRRELAQVLEDELSQPRKALEQLERIIELEPNNKEALVRLSSLYIDFDESQKAANTFASLLPLLAPTDNSTDTLRLYPTMIRTFHRHGKDTERDQALEGLLRHIPSYGTENPHWQSLPLAPDNSLTPPRALFHLGYTHKEPGLLLESSLRIEDSNPAVAPSIRKLGLSLEPLNPDIWHHLLTKTPESQRSEQWSKLEQTVQSVTLDESQRPLLSKLFGLMESELVPSDEVASLYSRLSDAGFTVSSLSQWYATLLESEGKLDKALQVRQDLLNLLPAGQERTELRFELAIQQLRVLEDIPGGTQKLWDLLADDPGFSEAFYELQQLYDTEGDLIGFVEAAENAVRQAPAGPARADLFLQTFEIFRALYYEADDVLEFLGRNVPHVEDDPHTLQIIGVAYEEASAMEQAADIYKKIAERGEPEDLAQQAVEQAAEIYITALESPDLAIDLLQPLLEEHPTHQRAFEQLYGAYEGLWMWNELGELIEKYAEHVDDPAEASRRLIQLGEMYLGRMEDYEKALQAYRKALRKTPKNINVLRSLQLLYEELEDWPAVVSALKAVNRMEVDRRALCDNYLTMARLSFDRLFRLEDTEEFYKLAHTQMPDKIEPLEGLVTLYDAMDKPYKMAETSALISILHTKQNRHEATVEGLTQMVEALKRLDDEEVTPEGLLRSVIQDRQESAALSQKLSDLLREVLRVGGGQEALTNLHVTLQTLYHQKLVELSWLLRLWHYSEEDTVPLAVVQSILNHVHEGSWSGIVKELVKLQQDAPPEAVASYQLSIAEIALHTLKQPQQAEAFAQRALSVGAPPERALAIYEFVQLANHNQLDLDRLLQLAREFAPPDDMSRALFHLGSSFLQHGSDWANALVCYLEAASLTPHGATYQAAVNDLQTMQQAYNQGQADPLQLKSLISSEASAPHRSLLEAWVAFKLHHLETGIESLRDTLESEPNNTPALRLMGHYLYKNNQARQAVAILYHFLEAEWDFLPFDEVVEVCVALAEMYSAEQGWDNALFYLEQATQFIPEDPRILKLQLQVLEKSNRWAELEELVQSHLDNPEPTDDLAQLWYTLGQLNELQKDNPTKALQCYENALSLNPDHQASQLAAQGLSQSSSLI